MKILGEAFAPRSLGAPAKKGLAAAATLFVAMWAGDVYAAPMLIEPADAIDSGNQTATSDIISEIQANYGPLTEQYKAEVDGNGDSGPFASFYETTFSNEPNDPADADIDWLGGSFIDAAEQYLLVKDGNQVPAWYFFDISSWDGQMELDLRNFWPDQGAISFVAIYTDEDDDNGGGVPPGIPEPATLALIGAGLAGLGLVSRRRRRQN